MGDTMKTILSIIKSCLCGWVLLLLTMVSGCVPVHLSSKIMINDQLQAIKPLEQGDVLVVYGESAAIPEESPARDYFTAGCSRGSGRNTIPDLITTILRVNPNPGRFAVKPLEEVEKGEGPDCTAGPDSILCRLSLSKTKVLMDRLRYAIHVKESFESKIHVPLYAMPAGIASCGQKTVLEAEVWELPTEEFTGSFTVSAEGEFTVVAYLYHLIVYSETQTDAIESLAREIVARFSGSKPEERINSEMVEKSRGGRMGLEQRPDLGGGL